MDIRNRLRPSHAPAPLLTIGLAVCFAFLAPRNKPSSASAQVTSPNGSYGILLNRWQDSSSNAASALLGVLNFDGAGNISGKYTIVQQDCTVSTGTLTGTYSGNPDGSNNVNLKLDVGATVTAAVAVTDAGARLQILVNGGTASPPGQVITGTGRMQAAQGTTPAGAYGYLLNRWPDANHASQAVFGMFNLDGSGNAAGSYIITNPGGGQTSITGTLTGSYSTGPDGAGSFTTTLDFGVTATFAIVVTDGGSGILMLQTNESDGFSQVISGTARRQ